jgi:pimeloyl-ACP methyl ester carboxylesterase
MTMTPPLLLVHGAWHDSRQWAELIPALADHGVAAAAIDLPGHGPGCPTPHGYPSADPADFADAPSAGIGLDDAADAVIDALAGADRPPVLLAHSMTGPVATRSVERRPDLVAGVAYLSAFVPTALPHAGAYLGVPEAAGAAGADLLLGDPAATGAFRLNPASTDEAYLAGLHEAFYTDLPVAAARRRLATLSPDLPAGFVLGEPGATARRWGSVPRVYIRCRDDRTLPIALQDRMIADADRLAPANPFRVHTIGTGHSPFASRPGELAGLLARALNQLAPLGAGA